MPRKPSNTTVWKKDILAQQETVSSSSSEAVQTPPPEPPQLIREPRKSNPQNYKLKMALLKTLENNYKVDEATLDQVAELFHIVSRASVLKV